MQSSTFSSRSFVKWTQAMVVGVAMSVGLFSAFPAHGVSTAATVSASGSRDLVKSENSDADVLRLLLAGQGPIADKNPELLRYLGFSESRPMTSPGALEALVRGFLKHHKDFRSEVRTPLETGDPRTVELTLMKLTNMYVEYAESAYGLQAPEMTAAKGCGKTKVCVVAYAAAVANALVYANAGVATLALAAAAAVFVVGPVFYLDDKDGVESRVTSLEKDEITLHLAEALRG